MMSRSAVIGSRTAAASAGLARPSQGEIEPVAGGHEVVGVPHRIARFGPGLGGAAEIAIEVVAEREVVIDIRVKRAGGNVACVGQAVRLDLIRLPRYQRDGLFEIGDRPVDLADRQVPVSAMAIHARVSRVSRDAFREQVDGLAILPEVCRASTHPDQGFRVVTVLLPRGNGVRELCLHLRLGLRRQLPRRQRPSKQRRNARLRFRGRRRGHDGASDDDGEPRAHGLKRATRARRT